MPNAEVKVGDITVGTVTGVAFDDWTAELTVSLRRSVTLPANAEARVAQKSLLGAEYLELAPPEHDRPVGTMRAGDDIPVPRTGQYPETEELLAALSALLNQGGLSQLKTVTTELNDALAGREGDARGLVRNVEALASTLDRRKGDIVRAVENLDRLSATLAEQDRVIDDALRTIPPGLAALERQRSSLVQTLDSVSSFGEVASNVLNTSRNDLHANLTALQPVLQKLADSGKDLTESAGMLPTFPFATNNAFPAVINGDYGNLYITVDLDAKTLSDNFTRGLTVAGIPLLGGSSLSEGIPGANPLASGQPGLLPLPPEPPGEAPPEGGLLDRPLDALVPGGT
ncbi:MCE family protein [Saccharopolyspora sp. HNM0983]|uniref:MCE family protein n=1 Tax=Saccharopolyspora montiporae TaxID=2781240 RepID=A0A929B517_9PSEU|nr:MCE family protein [Saccharopolyspora sp. HNM0983]